jgi:hypothetical protein
MTTVLLPGDRSHLVQVVAHPSCGYRAECVCGWCSAWVDQVDPAEAASSQHRGETLRPRHDLGSTMCDLLDLQDDLADAVFWLADNWPRDLPAPCAYDGGRDAALILLVRCPTARDLSRAAAVLASRVEAATGSGRLDAGRQAVKHIGRVRIVAYAADQA